jgi:predicted kinase
MLLMCGYPGSGKSYVSRLFGYDIVSNDLLGTAAKCRKMVTQVLKNGNNIIVDNTHSTVKSRKEYYDLAKKYDYKVKIVHIDNDIEFCYYMNQLRCQSSKGGHKIIPKIAYYTMRKKFVPPQEDECDVLIKITNKVSKYTLMFPGLCK